MAATKKRRNAIGEDISYLQAEISVPNDLDYHQLSVHVGLMALAKGVSVFQAEFHYRCTPQAVNSFQSYSCACWVPTP